jgi:hypothetical protein
MPPAPPSEVPSEAPAVEVPYAGPLTASIPDPMVIPSKAPSPGMVPSPALLARQPSSYEIPGGTQVPDGAPSHATDASNLSGAPTSTPSKGPVLTAAPPRQSIIAPEARGTLNERDEFPEARDPLTEHDELDDLVREVVETLQQSSSWEDFVGRSQSPEGDLQPYVGQLPHCAAHLLSRLRVSGAPVGTKSAPWTRRQK